MNPKSFYHLLIACVLCSLLLTTPSLAQGSCQAVTLDEFFACYGTKSAFNAHAVQALTTFIQTEDAINAGQYGRAKVLLDSLFARYPVGDNVWAQVWNAPNGANVGSPIGYYGLRMMQDIVAYGLNPNPLVVVKKVNMNVVVVGHSKGIQPTTKAELQSGTGTLVTHDINPKLKENNYRIVKQSLELFSKYVNAITNGALDLHVGFIELDTFNLPVSVSTTKPYVASGDYSLALNALSKAARDSTDFFLLTYPSHVPDLPVFDDESFITGGMGSDGKGGPVFIADDKWVIRKPAHLGKGDYTDIERRVYLPQWLQHEFFHHLFRLYPELKLEVKGHDWFDRSFWPADFSGQYETDYYSESLHKRIQQQCAALPRKLITRVGDKKPEYTVLSMDELLGAYSLDNIQNTWHEANIISENGKYYWKNKANVRWQVTPSFSEGRLTTGSDCPYLGQDFTIQLYQSAEGTDYPGVVSLKFGGEYYKKRFGLMRQTIPIEICVGSYKRVPSTNGEHEGIIVKAQGELFWKDNAGDSWTVGPNPADEMLTLSRDSSASSEKMYLINTTTSCGVYTLGFKYLDYYYWKPKRLAGDESPRVTKAINDQEFQKGFATHAIDLSKVFEDPTADSLLMFVTVKDTTVVGAAIKNQSLEVRERGEGSTTLYVMALDKNGGLAVDQFDVRVNNSSSEVADGSKRNILSVRPSMTSDVVTVSGYAPHSHLKLVSLEGFEENIPAVNDETTIDLREWAPGMYVLMCIDTATGGVQIAKVMKL